MEHILSNCKYFIQEDSMLQYMAKKMGVLIDHGPICHAEFSREGIELIWALAKVKYRNSPLSEKNNKESFRNVVRKCISRNWITTERVRHNARRARSYIVAYTQLHFGDSRTNPTNDSVPVSIEKLVKKYKTHRSALDIDSAYVNHLIELTKEESNHS